MLSVKSCLSSSFLILICFVLVQVIYLGHSVVNCRLRDKCHDMEEQGLRLIEEHPTDGPLWKPFHYSCYLNKKLKITRDIQAE
jgi:hypothetical protein